jgi:DNA (cytosine-5)-methyltransferase 1
VATEQGRNRGPATSNSSGRNGKRIRDYNRYALPTARGVPLKLTPRRGLAPSDPAAAKRWVKTIPRPWAIDLFCGAGGLGLGLHNSGIHVIAAADSDADATATYAANLGSAVFTGDLADPSEFLAFLDARGIKRVDIVAGGPPCQPFSRAVASPSPSAYVFTCAV